jgi:hypothetical protein
MNAKMKKLVALALALATFAGPALADEPATLSVGKIKDLNIKIYGFMENDLITDTTESFTEEPDNNLVSKPNTFAGSNHRAMMSVRNSRLGVDFKLPTTDSGLGTEGLIEMDFLGNNGPNVPPGSAVPGTQNERDFFNNPTARIRHAWVNLTQGDWGLRIGQYWSLLGWQPYYFPAEPNVQPAVGQLYRRFPQIRLTNTHLFGPDVQLETAVDMAKPDEYNSGEYDYHAGARISATNYKAAVLSGSGTNMVGLSLGVSGAFIPVRTADGQLNGQAIAIDTLIPIIPSKDGKDKSNNLSVMGEFVTGEGIGGLELAGLTFGVGSLNTAAPAAAVGTTVDSGTAGLNADGHVQLIRAQAFRGSVQYTLPNPKWTINAGYAQAQGMNLDAFTGGKGTAAASIAPLIQYGFASLIWDPLAWLRFGAEYSMDWDTYNDAANRYAQNNRFQFTTYFLF